jgi:hypothetical protein
VAYLIYRNKCGPPGCRACYKITVMKTCARSQQVSKTVQVSFKCLLNAQEMDYCVYAPNLTFALCKVVQEGQFDGSESSPDSIVCRLPAGKPRIVVRFWAGQSIFSVSPLQADHLWDSASLLSKGYRAVPREVKRLES